MGLAELRAQTAPQHQQLESRLNILESVQSRGDLLRHLQRFYHWIQPVEELITPSANQLPIEWKKRSRAKALAADIEFLGGSQSPPSVNDQLNVPPLSEAATLGILYVLEGSTLGGQVITGKFKDRFGLSADAGLRFYGGRGRDTAVYWREFLAVLEDFFNSHPEDADELYAAARWAFESIELALCSE